MNHQPSDYLRPSDAGLDLAAERVEKDAGSGSDAQRKSGEPDTPVRRAFGARIVSPNPKSKIQNPKSPARLWLHAKSFLTSAVVHAALLLILGLVAVRVGERMMATALVASFNTNDAVVHETLEHAATIDARDTMRDAEAIVRSDALGAPDVAAQSAATASSPTVSNAPPPIESFDARTLATRLTRPASSLLEGRHPAARAALVASGGGNAASEEAVRRGLRWLEAHQNRDGSWRFDHRLSDCGGLCRNPGAHASTTAATALGLLPFLGAGHTHVEGDFQRTVRDGLYYLTGRMKPTPHGGDLQEGTMYAQGMAAITLAEALAMTRDRALAEPALQAIRFINWAQNKDDGGWRYTPGQPGDMTVTGWQLMALKSGEMSYLASPPETMALVVRFLDALSDDDGARYGYLAPGDQPSTTAIGLLCRMYTGWSRDNRALARGVRFLSETGPSETDMYYNYYATLVLHHWGGYEWKVWNERMRDYLVRTQSTSGHEAGSWYFDDDHQSGAQGGRLYNTAMAVMMLEVYYRYLPLYDLDVLGK